MRATRTMVLILGIMGGVGGMIHGLAEVQKGNAGTGGHLLADAGAFTLIPNYLATGIAAMVLGAAAVGWTIGFVHRKHGPAVFLSIFAALFFVGGGIGYVPFFLLAWALATRIGRPVGWFRHGLLARWRSKVAAAWLPLLALSAGCLAAGMLVWMIVLPPGEVREISAMHYVCWSLLGTSLLLLPCAAVAALAKDAAALATDG